MKPIHFQGLNCYHSSFINAALIFGIDYCPAFAALWSETDFTYHSVRNVYLTKKLPKHLESLGVKLTPLYSPPQIDCKEKKTMLQTNQWYILGMDAVHIPWTPYYQQLNSPHYFLAKPEMNGSYLCLDPSYTPEYQQIMPDDILDYIFEINWVYQVSPHPSEIDLQTELQLVIDKHPVTLQTLIQQAKNPDYPQNLLAKYADAMMNNRYLYQYYLQANFPEYCFDKQLFQQWASIKNGFYKLFLSNHQNSILLDVCEQLTLVFDLEINHAEKMLRSSASPHLPIAF